MAGDVDDVVGAAHDEQVAVLVEVAAVPREVAALVRRQVGRDVAVVVAPQGGQRARRQRQPQHDRPLGARRHRLAPLVQDRHVVPGHRHAGRAGLERQRLEAPGAGGDRPTGLGLPPVVHHRDAQAFPRPVVGVRVEPLAGEEQGAQAAHVVAAQVLPARVLLLDGPQRGRRGEQPLDTVLGHHPPERAGVGGAHRLALVQHGGRPQQQGGVDDVGVADDPADVGGRPPRLPRRQVEDRAHAPQQRHRVPAVVAHDALRFAGGTAGVEHVEGVGGGDRHAVHRLGRGHRLIPVEVATRAQRSAHRVPLQHDAAGRGVVGQLEGPLDQRAVRDDPAGLDAAGRGDQDGGAGVVDAQGQLVGGEAAEHHRVHRADPGAGQHGDHRLRDHRQVHHHPVAGTHAEATQQPGAPGHLVEQLPVGELGLGPGHRAVVDQRRRVPAPPGDVPVQGVVAGVEPAPDEPAVEGGSAAVQHPVPAPLPRHRLGRLGPEALGVGEAALVGLPVVAHGRHPAPAARVVAPGGGRDGVLSRGRRRSPPAARTPRRSPGRGCPARSPGPRRRRPGAGTPGPRRAGTRSTPSRAWG